MKNRAKCKKCNTIIESFHATDYVLCTCGAIAVDGGEALKIYAKDFADLVRVDDEGNEVIVKVKNNKEIVHPECPVIPTSPTKHDLINMLDEMVENIEKLPSHAMSLPVTHYDFASALLLLSSILRLDCKEDS